MSTNNNLKSDALFTEAPASWNTKYLTLDGFECQLTLRGETGQEVLERAQGAVNFLLKNGCVPCVSSKNANRTAAINNAQTLNNPSISTETPSQTSSPSANGNGMSGNNAPANNPTSNSNGNGNDKGWCPIHQCEMKKWDKEGRVWYSHNVDGQWCSGKAKGK